MDQSDNCKTNLIINYLPQTLTDVEFRSMFESIGKLKGCKIVRHKSTGYSYGFGFVDYETSNDASRAIDTLNGYQLQNKRIKVAYARPGGEVIKNANLYIRGIPKTMEEDQLKKIFEDCGEIIQCRMLKDDYTGENKGVAFVLFDLHEQAEKAIELFSGQVLPGASEPLSIKFAEDNAKKLRVPPSAGQTTRVLSPIKTTSTAAGGPVRPNNSQNKYRYNPMTGSLQYGSVNSISPTEGGHTLFVYNIGIETDEKSLWQLFSHYGTINKVNVIRDTGTGASKGFGFVTMANYEEAMYAIENLHGFRYAGRPLQVSFKTNKM